MPITTRVICSPPLYKNILHHTMMDKLSSYDMGVPNLPFNIVDVFNLRHANWEAMFVSRAFRAAVGKIESRTTRLFGLMDENAQRSLLMYEVNSKDAGIIPVIFGSSDIFPLDLDSTIEYNRDLIEGTQKLRIVDQGHEELILTDLQNYKIPNRVARSYKKSKDSISFKRIETPDELKRLYLGVSYAETVDIQTNLYYGELIEPNMDDYDLQKLEEVYRLFHNPADFVKSLQAIFTRDPSIPSLSPNEFALYEVSYNGMYLGSAYMHIKGKDWYWVNTNRLRIKSLESEIPFNINDAILTNLIELAKSHGAETFNLGYAYYEYKDYYKPERIWQKGIRWY